MTQTKNTPKYSYPWYSLILIFLGYTIDFTIVWPIKLIYMALFKIPTESSLTWRFVGAIRTAGLLVFLHWMGSVAPHDTVTREVELKIWVENHSDISYRAISFIMMLINTIIAIDIILSILIFFGLCIEYDGFISSEGSTSGYSNIDEALNFQDGVANMQSTSGKVKEYGSTGFLTKDRVRGLGESSPEMREALGYLNGKLGMQSTSGKLSMLKNVFSK